MDAPFTVQAIEIYRGVWAMRRRISGRWPTPGNAEALRFAVTEVGEVLDARLRRNPAYKRNNDRQPTVEEELADVAIMLATGLGTESVEWITDLIMRAAQAQAIMREAVDLDALPRLVAESLDLCTHQAHTWRVRTAVALLAAVQLMDDPVKSVDARLQRLEAKWGGAQGAPGTPTEAEAGHPEVKAVPPGANGARAVAPLALTRLEQVILTQTLKGKAKYGAALTDQTAFPAWSFIWEELADLAVYLMRIEMDYEALQGDCEAAVAARDKARHVLEITQAKLVAAERSADTWRDRWERLYRSYSPGGLDLPNGGRDNACSMGKQAPEA